MNSILFFVLFYYILITNAISYYTPLQGSIGGKRILVLFDDMAKIHSHSIFFNNLKLRGYELSILHSESNDVKLKKYGEYLYDNLIIFAPTTESFHSLSIKDFQEFTEAGGNMLICVNSDLSQEIRNLVENCGIDVDRKGAAVIDHFSFEPSIDSSFHTAILTSNIINSDVILGKYENSNPILYRGIGHSFDESNMLAVNVLRGNPTSYSANLKHILDSSSDSISTNTSLISAIQARNNARIVVSGSIDMFSNIFFRKKQTSNSYVGNELFCEELSKWVFRESGILRFRDIVHHKTDGNLPDFLLQEKKKPELPKTLYPDPELARNSLVYRIKDEIFFSMIVEQYINNNWTPFSANDMQLELVMLDPYVRKNMTSDPITGKFETIILAPDSYGIFKFRVIYRRIGYSVIHSETQVSIRPFKHDEYERFIISAYPYYFSSFSALIVFFIFNFVFLLS